jgi:hypothetical protein
MFNGNTNQIFSSAQPSISNHRSDVAWSSEDDLDMSSEDSLRKHQWQTVNNNRRRIYPQTSAEIVEQIQTTNRFESLSELPCDRKQNGTSTNMKTPDHPNREPKPPPIYIYGVNNLKAMLDNFAMVTANETYIVKALPKDTMKTMPNTSKTYRKLIQHVRERKIIHHS